MVKVNPESENRICQGDIIKKVPYLKRIDYGPLEKNTKEIEFPYIIVLTQDCDLESDYRTKTTDNQNDDKKILSVIVAPLYNYEHVRKGTHLEFLEYKMENIPSKYKNILENNKNPRYHYLMFPDTINLTALVIDFKHYFTIDVDFLQKIKSTNFICKVEELYREDISSRFAHFLSRIGLPATVRQ